jgi:hypothetical protein
VHQRHELREKFVGRGKSRLGRIWKSPLGWRAFRVAVLGWAPKTSITGK